MTSNSRLKVTLLGNPNSGKSSLFNSLTGLRQHTSNFPGVTVEKKYGTIKYKDGFSVTLIDLPGCYSLFPNSSDEKIVVNILANPKDDNHPDLVIYILDINNLERHLLLASQIYDLNIPMIIAINMVDTIENYEKSIDITPLQQYFGKECIPISTKLGLNIDLLKEKIRITLNSKQDIHTPKYELSRQEKNAVDQIKDVIDYKNEYLNKINLHHFQWLNHVTAAQKINISAIIEKSGFQNINRQIEETMMRFQDLQPIVQSTLPIKKKIEGAHITDKIDAIVTHKVAGPIIFLGIMLLVFQAIYSWAQTPMEWIEGIFADLGAYTKYVFGQGWIADLLTDGILAGLSGVLVFIPQITILF
ncbi:MAG TPA: FeoB small GTPase domain-containing protein, partial [Saprospiraceae bacterium]|nr:FeoB small GTPase domain-containing protein [Saprospiraceae bacterium]